MVNFFFWAVKRCSIVFKFLLNPTCYVEYTTSALLFFKSLSELLLLAHIEKFFFVKVFVDEKSPIVIKTNCLWIEVINVEGRSLMKAICSKLCKNCTIPDKTPAPAIHPKLYRNCAFPQNFSPGT